MTKALRIGDFSLRDIVELQSSDSFSVQFNPFLNGPGARQGGTFIRNAVSWKGITRNPEEETLPEYFARLSEYNEGASKGLSTIAERLGANDETYTELEGKDGVVLAEIDRTDTKNGMKGSQTLMLPAPAFVAAEEASNNDVHVEPIKEAPSYNALLETSAQAREKMTMPAVY